MDIFNSLVSSFLYFGMFAYWIVFFISFAESFVFLGLIIPGSVLVVLSGFLAAQGYFDFGQLLWFACMGAILGDGLSYFLGTKGVRFFKDERRWLTTVHLEKGEKFFKKHGSKSVFFGRFLRPVRPIIPFVAGLFKMNVWEFLFWNIVSGFLWAFGYLLLGYFFGGTVYALESWATRAEFFVVIITLFILIFWFFLKKGKSIFLFLQSIGRSAKDGIIANADIQTLFKKHPRFVAFLKKRLEKKNFSGLPLTLIFFSFVYVIFLYFGVVEAVLTSALIVDTDIRIANLFYAFRDESLIVFFMWITLLGKWQVVLLGAIFASILFFVWQKKEYIIPFWITILGSVLFSQLGKLAFHRPRPEVAYYTESGFSFPSGHATIAVAFYGFLMYVFLKGVRKWSRKANIFFIGLSIIFFIGLSRLYLGVHYLSDVWGGYLSGLLLLIIGIALIEWRQRRAQKKESTTIPYNGRHITAWLVGIWALLYVFFGFYYEPHMQLPKRDTRIVVEDVFEPFEKRNFSRYSETLTGANQEPLSFLLLSQSDEDVVSMMKDAGWLLSDEVTFSALLALAKSAVFSQSYATAPMTPSFWNAHIHDLGFQKETEEQNVKERHHVRFWKTDIHMKDGRYIYVGTASFDSDIKWYVTHKIDPDIDTERELLYKDMKNTTWIESSRKESFVPPTLGKNFGGDPFFTDGDIYVIELKK